MEEDFQQKEIFSLLKEASARRIRYSGYRDERDEASSVAETKILSNRNWGLCEFGFHAAGRFGHGQQQHFGLSGVSSLGSSSLTWGFCKLRVT